MVVWLWATRKCLTLASLPTLACSAYPAIEKTDEYAGRALNLALQLLSQDIDAATPGCCGSRTGC